MPVKRTDVFILRLLMVLALIYFLVLIPFGIAINMEKKKLNQLYEKQIEQRLLLDQEFEKLILDLQTVTNRVQERLDHPE